MANSDKPWAAGGTRAIFWALACLALGIGLRLHQFFDQVLIDDEWHAVHQVMLSDVKTIVTSFGLADYSIPLTLYYKLLAETIGLSEFGMRLPMLAAGVALLVFFPLWVRPRLGVATALVFMALLATSPLLFYYSRIARPYGLSLILAPIAVWWFCRWWETKRTHFFTGYALLSVALTWLHLLNAPFVFAPFVWAGFAKLSQQRSAAAPTDAPSWTALIKAAAVCLAGLAIFVLPPFVVAPQALAEKTGAHLPTVKTIVGAAHQWFGTASRPLLALLFLLAAYGAPRVLRASGRFGQMIVFGLLCTFGAVLLLQPAWVIHALTFARYLILLLPVALLCCAAGVVRLAENAAVPRAFLIVFGIVLAAIPMATTPLTELVSFSNPRQYSNHSYYHFDVRASKNPTRPMLHEFNQSAGWERLDQTLVGAAAVGFFPWSLESYYDDHVIHQIAINQTLLPVSTEGVCSEWKVGHPKLGGGIELQNFVVLKRWFEPAAVPPPVRFLAMRKSVVVGERSQCIHSTFSEWPRCNGKLTARFGPAIYEDELLVIFDTQNRPKETR